MTTEVLARYKLGRKLGAGGMGVVYEAQDLRLGRLVALKFLPEEIASEPHALERFRCEARAASLLNHPNICTIHDVGVDERGCTFIVMERMDGATLAESIAGKPLPIDKVLQIGIQISDALAAAHAKGIVHRDLKPGNIMLTQSGAKLMDFGLAKTARTLKTESDASALTADSVAGRITTDGKMVGTLQYMSPEQLEGREADARSDIFAVGCVLYEMVSGKRAFEGKSNLAIASAIVEKAPEPLSVSQPLTPPLLQRVIRRCLEKSPEERYQATRDLVLDLRAIAAAPSDTEKAAATAAQATRLRWAWALGILAALIALLSIKFWLRIPSPSPLVQTSIVAPPDSRGFQFSGEGFGAAVISPDGRRVAFTVVGKDGERRLWVRALDSTTAQELSGTHNASYPFWSPDSRHIAFSADGELKKISVSGGNVQTLCSGRLGGTWNRDGVIVFSDEESPLYRVADVGGTPEQITKLAASETSHRWPWFLPDGKHFLFSVFAWGTAPRLWLGSLDGVTPPKPLLETAKNGLFAAPEYLLFVRDSTLMAKPFNIRNMEFTGSAVPVAESVGANGSIGQVVVSVSESGHLLYGGKAAVEKLEWRDRTGKAVGEVSDAGSFFAVKIAPGGNAVVASLTRSGKTDLYLADLTRAGTRSRLTFESGDYTYPVWYPDGKRIAFASNRNGRVQLFTRDLSGAGEEQLLQDEYDNFPVSVSPDGRFLAYNRSDAASGASQIWILPLAEKAAPFQFQPLPASFKSPNQFSPDGRWLSYVSDESGRPEVYVAPFPLGNKKWQVSTSGGNSALWRADGKELFYLHKDSIISVAVRLGLAPHFGPPRRLFSAPINWAPPGYNYDVSADGKRFLVMTKSENHSDVPLTLVQNWTALLKK